MPETERPKSRINGKINPAYTAWRKNHIVVLSRETAPAAVANEDGTKTITLGFDIPGPQILTLKCIKAAKNPKFVFCDLGGVKVPVRCKRGLSKKMPGKRIKVSVDNSGEKPVYTHIR